jgi:S-adenosylmethionine decarboxylase
MDTRGRHVVAELDGCDSEILSDSATIRGLLLEAARRTGATVLADEIFAFKTGGVSGFVLLAESHVSIHTWPEHRYAAIDIYTCGDHTMPDKGCIFLADAVGASQLKMTALSRGVPGVGGGHEHYLGPAGRERNSAAVIRYPQSA